MPLCSEFLQDVDGCCDFRERGRDDNSVSNISTSWIKNISWRKKRFLLSNQLYSHTPCFPGLVSVLVCFTFLPSMAQAVL